MIAKRSDSSFNMQAFLVCCCFAVVSGLRMPSHRLLPKSDVQESPKENVNFGKQIRSRQLKKLGKVECISLPHSCVETQTDKLNWKGPSQYDEGRSTKWLYGQTDDMPLNPLQIHVGGLEQGDLQEALNDLKFRVHDPLMYSRLRHLEATIKWAPQEHGNQTSISEMREQWGKKEGPLMMVWPEWEAVYDSTLFGTFLSLGELIHDNTMPKHLALSGLKAVGELLPPLLKATEMVCASERPNPPRLPQCKSACYDEILICAPNKNSVTDVSVAMKTLDKAAGWDALATAPGGEKNLALTAGGECKLRVLFAEKGGKRSINNLNQLVAECNDAILSPNYVDSKRLNPVLSVYTSQPCKLQCNVLALGTSEEDKVAALRNTDVFIAMWGTDMVQALRLGHGAATIELVDNLFADSIQPDFLTEQKNAVTRMSPSQKLNYEQVKVTTLLSDVINELDYAKAMKDKTCIGALERQLYYDTALTGMGAFIGDTYVNSVEYECPWNTNRTIHWREVRPAVERAHAYIAAQQL